MSNFAEDFQKLRVQIEDRKSGITNVPLMQLLDKINGGLKTGFNRAVLQENNIDPDKFLATWALGFAKSALSLSSTYRPFVETAHTRCGICLSKETPDSFGHYISPELRGELYRQRNKLAPLLK